MPSLSSGQFRPRSHPPMPDFLDPLVAARRPHHSSAAQRARARLIRTVVHHSHLHHPRPASWERATRLSQRFGPIQATLSWKGGAFYLRVALWGTGLWWERRLRGPEKRTR